MELEYLRHAEEIGRSELDELMAAFGDDIWKYAYAITRDREQAKDIAQEVFIRAYRGIHAFRGQSSVRTWLLSITRNLSLNHLSSGYWRKVFSFANVRRPDSAASAENAYFGRQSAAELWKIILNLPDKLREALVLEVEHELTQASIAAVLGVPEGTVKSRLHRARRIVERQWEERNRNDR